MLQQLADATPEERGRILSMLLEAYLPGLRVFLIKKHRIDADRVDDILQDFTVDRILERELFLKANREAGHFHSLLLKTLERFLIDRHRHDNARIRSPERIEHRLEFVEPRDPAPRPESKNIDADWSRMVLRETLARFWSMSQSEAGRRNWKTFYYRLLWPLLTGGLPLGYAKIVELCGFETPQDAANALVTAKRLVNRCLRSVIAEYCTDEAEVEVQIAELAKSLAGKTAESPFGDFAVPDMEGTLGTYCAVGDLSQLYQLDKYCGAQWSDDDVAEMVRHALATPLEAAIPSALDDPAVAEWREQSVRELFLSASPPIQLLMAVKTLGRQWLECKPRIVPDMLGGLYYFASIAVALNIYNARITRSRDISISIGIRQLTASRSLDDQMRDIIGRCLTKINSIQSPPA